MALAEHIQSLRPTAMNRRLPPRFRQSWTLARQARLTASPPTARCPAAGRFEDEPPAAQGRSEELMGATYGAGLQL
jgi:hypothetical protein